MATKPPNPNFGGKLLSSNCENNLHISPVESDAQENLTILNILMEALYCLVMIHCYAK